MVSSITCCVVPFVVDACCSLVLLSCVTLESTERGHLPFTIFVGDNMHSVFYGITRLQPYINEYKCKPAGLVRLGAQLLPRALSSSASVLAPRGPEVKVSKRQ